MTILAADKVHRYFWLLVSFWWTLKSESAWDHVVNVKFNVFYSTFTNVFHSCHVFMFFNVSFILISTFFTSVALTAVPLLLSY